MNDVEAAADALTDDEHELNQSLALKNAQVENLRTVEMNERGNTRF